MTSSQADPGVARLEALPVSVLEGVLDRLGRRSPVFPGDLVRGDENGVVVVPKTLGEEALAAVGEKPGSSASCRDRLEHGESGASLDDPYGVL